ncbi:CDGSH iron-sulfur domain-containing protein [Amycolatopsis sp. A133]|uniref:CDGSH iron-sulfur domain-containing protein n=1 Tax=Amycolatopsis sp. A133 TaxID=3064472 RepID=UPI0027FEC8F9|nr:CDGSH iron-sulfur domain-containing protein [Amycolatopsis sp. A133]MDQ7811055.1 CDGSH iron-sulfur domain-containing protein [Amycolatopsis sp. A133]
MPTAERGPRRVTVVPGGPVLVEGPVELSTPDGELVRSDRFLVAVCACRRSKRFPFCDTSHRKRIRTQANDDS